ncbi:MAG: 4-hydroxy-3-methylbut-2-enyl diphosphate reductase [Deltaproteobacteria bacterium]
MKVKQARTAGFCMGVRRALERVLGEAYKEPGPIYTYGPLIHNEQVMKLLESKGVQIARDVSSLKEGTIVIRAHGIPPQQRRLLKSSGLKIIDATCPRVARVQALIRYHTHQGYLTVIVGEQDHPEVIGLKGYGKGKALVITTAEEVSLLPESEKVLVVAQTTQEKQTYDHIAEAIKKRFPEALVFNTICGATESRQEEVRALATHVDGIVVVGGFHSGNTRRLAQVASSTGLPVFHIETDKQLDSGKLAAMESIGVTAGASTPNWMINKVVQKIESIRSRKETALNRFLRYATKFVFQCNLVAAFGAFSLAHAMNVLSERPLDLILPSLAFLYIYAMHVLNRLLDKGAGTYNDPERAAFYRKYRSLLILSGVVAIAGALVLSAFMSLWALLATAGLSILGTVYGLPIVPLRKRHLWRYSKIKDIPGSKTFAQAFAWAAVMAILPLLAPPGGAWTSELVSFFFVFSTIYVRSAFFDIFQFQGDLIVGSETLPITLGEKRTLLLLKWVIAAGSMVLVVAPLLGWAGPFAYLLLLCYLNLTLCILAYEKRALSPGTRSEAFVEANLLLAGFLAVLWQWLP